MSTASTSATASAEVGSSMISTRGSKAAARAIAMAWRWPPESSAHQGRRDCGMRMSSASRCARASACIRRLVEQRSRPTGAVRGRGTGCRRRRSCRRATGPGRPSRSGVPGPRPGVVKLDGPRRRLDRAGVGHVGAGDASWSASTCRRRCRRPGPSTSPGPQVEVDAAQRLDRAEASCRSRAAGCAGPGRPWPLPDPASAII